MQPRSGSPKVLDRLHNCSMDNSLRPFVQLAMQIITEGIRVDDRQDMLATETVSYDMEGLHNSGHQHFSLAAFVFTAEGIYMKL